MKCPKCGKQGRELTVYCGHCERTYGIDAYAIDPAELLLWAENEAAQYYGWIKLVDLKKKLEAEHALP